MALIELDFKLQRKLVLFLFSFFYLCLYTFVEIELEINLYAGYYLTSAKESEQTISIKKNITELN